MGEQFVDAVVGFASFTYDQNAHARRVERIDESLAAVLLPSVALDAAGDQVWTGASDERGIHAVQGSVRKRR